MVKGYVELLDTIILPQYVFIGVSEALSSNPIRSFSPFINSLVRHRNPPISPHSPSHTCFSSSVLKALTLSVKS